MLEKIELRKKLKEISLVKAEYSQRVIDNLQNVIKDKIVCTYIPLENEVNINMHLKGHSILATTCLEDGELKICIYCLLYTSPSPRDRQKSRMPSSA